jgi:type IV pilus modification protein PilV
MSKRRNRREHGFTLIEVMMSLTVLVIGVLGVMVLQTATIAGNQDAVQITTANAIARLWLDRLQRDATQWNHPSSVQPTSNISSTQWLNNVGSGWFVPAATATESPAFDVTGQDMLLTPFEDKADYCTHVRLTYLDASSSLIRAEIRVVWPKRVKGDLANWAKVSTTWCQTATATTLGPDDLNFHWIYAAGAIRKVLPQ